MFDGWRNIYNTERPHEALGMKTPVSRYRFSNRQYPEKIPEIEYGPNDQIRKVQINGIIYFKNKEFRVSKAFKGQNVAIRATNVDGKFSIHFCNQTIGHVDLTCIH